MDINAVYEFFKGIQDKIDELSFIKSKLLNDKIEDSKSEFYRLFVSNIMEYYMLENEPKIDAYNKLFSSIENCLKTNLEQLQGYIKECPVMYEFISAYLVCNISTVSDSTIVAFKQLSEK